MVGDRFEQRCINCRAICEPTMFQSRCARCKGIIRMSYDYTAIGRELSRASLKMRPTNLWKFFELLPVLHRKNMISLGEGNTPLLKSDRFASKLGLTKLFMKDETRLPTGSLKDRCATVTVSKAAEANCENVVVSSSGNGAAAMSAYCAKGGIGCKVFVPTSASAGKLAQSIAFGARVIKVSGSTMNASKLASEVSERFGWPNVSTAAVFNPYALEGQKTCAYEIAEQLDWKVPDWVVLPVGSGNNLAGQWAGFSDLVELGIIGKRPRIAAVQAEGCAPFAEAFTKGLRPSEVETWDRPETIAAGVNDAYPFDVELALPALRESNGTAVTVSDDEILDTVAELSSMEGVFTEPTGAVAAAGLKRLVASGEVEKDEVVVTLLTGSGLKDPGSLAGRMPEPPEVAPDFNEASRFML